MSDVEHSQNINPCRLDSCKFEPDGKSGIFPLLCQGTITKLYVDRYCVPPPGMGVFIRTRQLLNGWVDFPR